LLGDRVERSDGDLRRAFGRLGRRLRGLGHGGFLDDGFFGIKGGTSALTRGSDQGIQPAGVGCALSVESTCSPRTRSPSN
jgi:hypothetical protein